MRLDGEKEKRRMRTLCDVLDVALVAKALSKSPSA